MDPLTQNIDQNIDEYLNSLVADCLQTPSLSTLSQEQKGIFAQQIKDYFYQAALEALVDKLNGEQFSQIEHLNPGSPEMAEKIQQLASQVPGLSNDIEKRLQQDVSYIKQNSKIPEASSGT